jgi:polysaccharide transporter, PST family
MKRRHLFNVAGLYGVQGLNLLLPLLTLPFLFRTLGPEGFGKLAFSLGVAMTVVMLTDAGFPQAAFRLISKSANGKCTKFSLGGRRNRVFCATQQVRAILALVLCSVVAVGLWVMKVEAETRFLIAIGALNVVGTLSLPAYYFTARQYGHLLAFAHCVGRLITTGALLLFVRDASDLWIAMTVNSSATLISGVIAHWWLYRAKEFHPKSYFQMRKPDCRLLLKQTSHLYFSQAVQAFIVNAPVILLGVFHGKTEAGLFSAVDKFGRLFVALIEPINTAIAPTIQRMSQHDASNSQKSANHVFYAVTIVSFFGMIFLMFFAETVLRFVFGNISDLQIDLLRLFAAWAFIHSLSRNLEVFRYLLANQLAAHRNILQTFLPIQCVSIAGGAFFGAKYTVVAMLICECFLLLRFGFGSRAFWWAK